MVRGPFVFSKIFGKSVFLRIGVDIVHHLREILRGINMGSLERLLKKGAMTLFLKIECNCVGLEQLPKTKVNFLDDQFFFRSFSFDAYQKVEMVPHQTPCKQFQNRRKVKI